MGGKFILASENKGQEMDWGRLAWLSSPSVTGSAQLAIVEGSFRPDTGHSFHKHMEQEEVLFVVHGQFEHWIEQERRVLGPGDSAFMSPGTVHASFNVGDRDAKLVAIFSPCIGSGFETVDVAGEVPWNTLRLR
jgi:quercetin dioxygenase-like cupin family protein